MSVVKSPVAVDLLALGVPAFMRSDPDSGGFTIEADLPEADLAARVAGAPAAGAPKAEDTRLAQALAKAAAILADPVNATDWTAAERKVLLAALVRRVLR